MSDKLRMVHYMGRELLFGELIPNSAPEYLYPDFLGELTPEMENFRKRLGEYFTELEEFNKNRRDEIISRMKIVLDRAKSKNIHIEMLYVMFRNDIILASHTMKNTPEIILQFLDSVYGIIWKTRGYKEYREEKVEKTYNNFLQAWYKFCIGSNAEFIFRTGRLLHLMSNEYNFSEFALESKQSEKFIKALYEDQTLGIRILNELSDVKDLDAHDMLQAIPKLKREDLSGFLQYIMQIKSYSTSDFSACLKKFNYQRVRSAPNKEERMIIITSIEQAIAARYANMSSNAGTESASALVPAENCMYFAGSFADTRMLKLTKDTSTVLSLGAATNCCFMLGGDAANLVTLSIVSPIAANFYDLENRRRKWFSFIWEYLEPEAYGKDEFLIRELRTQADSARYIAFGAQGGSQEESTNYRYFHRNVSSPDSKGEKKIIKSSEEYTIPLRKVLVLDNVEANHTIESCDFNEILDEIREQALPFYKAVYLGSERNDIQNLDSFTGHKQFVKFSNPPSHLGWPGFDDSKKMFKLLEQEDDTELTCRVSKDRGDFHRAWYFENYFQKSIKHSIGATQLRDNMAKMASVKNTMRRHLKLDKSGDFRTLVIESKTHVFGCIVFSLINEKDLLVNFAYLSAAITATSKEAVRSAVVSTVKKMLEEDSLQDAKIFIEIESMFYNGTSDILIEIATEILFTVKDYESSYVNVENLKSLFPAQKDKDKIETRKDTNPKAVISNFLKLITAKGSRKVSKPFVIEELENSLFAVNISDNELKIAVDGYDEFNIDPVVCSQIKGFKTQTKT